MRRALTVVLVLVLVAGVVLSGRAPARAQKGPVKIGFVVPLSGPLAANGKDTVNGLQMFLDEHGSRLGGREVKLILEDDEGKPATGLTKARSLVESQGVHLLIGSISAAVGYALSPYIEARKIPSLYPIVAADDLTQRKRNPYIVRTGWTSSQPSHPFGKWVYDNLKYKKIAVIGYDFAYGWEVVAGFQRTYEEAGGQVVQKLWPPLGNADFAPYITQLRRDADAVFAIFSGADALRFTKQFADAGLKDKLPIVAGGTVTDEHVLRSMGDEVLGIVSALHYSAALQTPANKKFASAYEGKFKQIPSYYSEGAYVAGSALKAALEATGGDIENVDRFLTALRQVDLADAPRGPIKLDDFGNPVQNVYVRKVEKVNGRLQNTVIHTFPGVSQFWTYKPEEFLKAPVYSRDNPPCKHCS
jgi:branched-chain amino acid transport system substrate-binding protein